MVEARGAARAVRNEIAMLIGATGFRGDASSTSRKPGFCLRSRFTFFEKKDLRGSTYAVIKGAPVRKLTFSILFSACVLPALATAAIKETLNFKPQFVFQDRNGKTVSAPIMDQYQPKQIIHPFARVDSKIGPQLRRAASIAEERAHAHSRMRCWHYVKEALVAAGVVSSRPKSEYAKDAGEELVKNFGFKKLAVRDPYKAPIGSVLVYGAKRAAGHVEFRTKSGFVSDFHSKTPSRRPLLGVYAKA